MTGTTEPPRSALPSLTGATWLSEPATCAVLAALAGSGFEGRVVGGSVRNTLMGLAVSDIDIATPAIPDEVVRACAAVGLTTVPTGIEHGTVTVLARHRPIEVTTLRRDVATDGRRATVAFTTDWAEDAHRRDFTMNALYCDADGRLYDYVGGYDDVMTRRVRFIGDADQRIAEDYLRILRFFRFHAAYANGPPDPVAMAACARGLGGMTRLSAERIRAEVVKLLVAPGVVGAVRAMEDIGLLPRLLGVAPRPDLMQDIVAAETRAALPPDAMLRLSALAIATSEDIDRVADRLRLSNDERKALLVIDRDAVHQLGVIDEQSARRITYRRGSDASRRLALAVGAIEPARGTEAIRLLETAMSWPAPKLPVAGADLIHLGMKPGREVGRVLAELENWWVENDFPPAEPTRAKLEALIAHLGRM
jgi:poly(A) polymerase